MTGRLLLDNSVLNTRTMFSDEAIGSRRTWRMRPIVRGVYFSLAGGFSTLGVIEVFQGTGVLHLYRGAAFGSRAGDVVVGALMLVVAGGGFALAAIRSRIIVTPSEVIAINALRSITIRRADVRGFEAGRDGIAIRFRSSDDGEKLFFASAGQGLIAVRLFGHATYPQSLAAELAAIVGAPPMA